MHCVQKKDVGPRDEGESSRLVHINDRSLYEEAQSKDYSDQEADARRHDSNFTKKPTENSNHQYQNRAVIKLWSENSLLKNFLRVSIRLKITFKRI